MNPDYFMIPLIMGQVSHIVAALKTGYVIMDCCLFALLYLLYKNVDARTLKQQFYTLIRRNNKKQTVVLMSSEDKRSVKFRALMLYLSKRKETIYKIREVVESAWDDDEQQRVEQTSEYIVDQSKEFMLTPGIFGSITNNSKEKMRGLAGTEYIEYNIVKIFSYTLSLNELQEWLNLIVKEYKQYLKNKSNETQLYITVSNENNKKKSRDSSSSKSSDIHIEAVPWESTITFENSYFNKMDDVIKKIDFFLNNKEWYKEKGIPYNLGILLYGEPGCGKTRFIKQLMNYTGRHGIDIKLNDQMNFQDLYNIIFKEEINDDYIIPQDQRILIFEDIDAMGEAVKCRDTRINEKKQKDDEFVKVDKQLNMLEELLKDTKGLKNKTVKDLHDIESSSSDGESGSASVSGASVSGASVSAASVSAASLASAASAANAVNANNLSYLLNMFDGINECSGRIIIMTSNKPEVLDKALIRPGRIDIKIQFNKCSKYDVMRLTNLFWDLDLEEDEFLPELEMKYTSAEIYNIFRSTNEFDDIQSLLLNSITWTRYNLRPS